MKTLFIEDGAIKLLELMQGKYSLYPADKFGFAQYQDYESRYIFPMGEEERLQIFIEAYKHLPEENLGQLIQQFFLLSGSFKVPLYKRYFEILLLDQSNTKRQLFFTKMCERIEGVWYEKQKQELRGNVKNYALMQKYCQLYGIKIPV